MWFGLWYIISCENEPCESQAKQCTSGSGVEHRLAKARVVGSNPISCLYLTG